MNGLWQTTVTYGRWGFPPAVSSTYKQDVVFNNATGNVTSRQDYLRSKSESFTYDTGLDRLLTVTGPQNLTMNYAANGNFSQKSDVGSVYTYGTTGKPYQLTEIETSTGLVSDVEQTVVYTSFEQPSSITESPYQALFTYNADGERAKMEVKQSGAIKTRWYAGSRYIKETAGGITKEFTWIGGDAYSAPCLAVTQSGATTYYYLLRDHLGTITHITDASGNVVNEYSFDAWGRRRNFTDWSYNVAAQTDILPDRGFTGHEYLPWFKLYNMNGRLYDPVVGRFLEPDPIVQDASSTQNLNRYSYCLNNPLKYTDPSGNRFLQDMQNWYDGTGTGFWYRGDYYNQDGNGNWTGSFSGNTPGGGSPGGSTYGIGTGDAGPSYSEWLQNKARKESLGPNNIWIQLGFYYYDEKGNPININGNYGEFWIYETSPFTYISTSKKSTTTGLDWKFYAGAGISIVENSMYSNDFGSWMGKDFKIRSLSWGGNGTTGGKYSFAKTTSNKIGMVGKVVGVYSMYTSINRWQKGEIDNTIFAGDMVSGLAGIFGGIYGASWSIGWELGKSYGPSTWFTPKPQESILIEYLKTHK